MVLEKARELGIALSESEEFIRFQTARTLMDMNKAVSATLQEYKDKQEQLVDLLSTDSPDRLLIASLSKDTETLQEQLLANPVFSEAMEAQNAFQQLMSQVNQEIAACIGADSDRSDGCGGHCEGCKGCQ